MGKEHEVKIKIVGDLDRSFENAIQLAQNGLKVMGKYGPASMKQTGRSVETATGAMISFQNAIQLAQNSLGAIGKGGVAAMKLAGKGMAATAGAMTALGASAVKTGSEFEKSMSQVSATMLLDKSTEAGAAAYKTLEDAAREQGRQTAYSATEAAEALNYLALAGYDAEQAAAALPTVLRLAGAGEMELAQASDMVTDSMSALGITATQTNLESFADKMALTASRSNTSVSQLGEAILAVGGTAKGLADGTTELNASLGILADSGIKAADGGVHLRNMILSLQNPRNKQAAQLMEDIGFSAYDSEGNMRSLGESFGDLNREISKMDAAEANSFIATIFKQTDLAAARAMLAATGDSVDSLAAVMDSALLESGQSIAGLGIDLGQMAAGFDTAITQEQFAAQMMEQYGMSAENAGVLFSGLQSIASDTGNRFEELSGAIGNAAGAAQEMYDTQQDNLLGDVDKLKSAFSDLQISIYEDVGGPLRDVSQEAADMVNNINGAYINSGVGAALAQAGTELASAATDLAATAPRLSETAAMMMQSFLGGIQANLPTITSGLASAAVSALQGLAFIFPQFLQAGMQAVSGFASGIAQNMPQVLSSLVTGIAGIGQAFMTGIPQLLQAGAQVIRSLAEGIGQALPTLIPLAMNSLLTFSENLRANFGELFSAGMELILQVGNGLISALPTFIETVPQIVTNIAGLINDNAPKLIATGIQLIGSLAVGIVQAVPTLIANIPQIIQAVISVFTAVNWVNLGMTVIRNIAAGVASLATSIPRVFSNFINMSKSIVTSFSWQSLGRGIIMTIGQGITSLISAIPKLFLNMGKLAISALTNIDWWSVGTAIIQLIGEAISGAGGFLIDAVKGIGGSVIDGIKGIFSGDGGAAEAVSSGQATASSYASGISQGASQASSAAAELNAQAFSFMDFTQAEDAGMQSGESFITGLSESMAAEPLDLSTFNMDTESLSGQMTQAGTDAGLSLSTAFGEQLPKITTQAQQGMTDTQGIVTSGVDGMVGAIRSGGAQAVSSAQSTANSVMNVFNGIDLTASGRNMMQGFLNGINAMRGQVEAAARSVADAAASAVNNALQIHSPSRLMIESGQYTGEGLAIGMQDSVPEVAQAAVQMAQPVAVMAESSGVDIPQMHDTGSIIKEALSSLTCMAGGGTGSTDAQAGSVVFNYSPNFVIEGNADVETVHEAERMSQAEFEAMANRWVRNRGRTAFA